GGVARTRPHHHVGHGHQEPAMRPAERIAMTLLERQSDAQVLTLGLEPKRTDQGDEFVGDVEFPEARWDQFVHVGNPSLEVASLSSAARTAGSKAVARCVSSFSDTIVTFCTAVQ